MTVAAVSALAVGLFACTLLLLETGRWLGSRWITRNPGEAPGLGTLEGAVFGLMGLLIAFTFSGAASRFDLKRQLIVQEANAIGTAYRRIDLLPAVIQSALREDFSNYLNARLAIYRRLPDVAAAKEHMAQATELQGRIWSRAVTACREVSSPATPILVLSSLNEMIDITTTRTVALQTHPPAIIFALLVGLALACSLLAGYATAGKGRSWIHMLGFATVLAITVYVILDLEYPRVGLIRLDPVDNALIGLRDNMK